MKESHVGRSVTNPGDGLTRQAKIVDALGVDGADISDQPQASWNTGTGPAREAPIRPLWPLAHRKNDVCRYPQLCLYPLGQRRRERVAPLCVLPHPPQRVACHKEALWRIQVARPPATEASDPPQGRTRHYASSNPYLVVLPVDNGGCVVNALKRACHSHRGGSGIEDVNDVGVNIGRVTERATVDDRPPPMSEMNPASREWDLLPRVRLRVAMDVERNVTAASGELDAEADRLLFARNGEITLTNEQHPHERSES